MKLSDSERISACWVKLEKHMKSEIDLLRQRNDADIDAVKTATIRGQILALKKVLSLAATDKSDE